MFEAWNETILVSGVIVSAFIWLNVLTLSPQPRPASEAGRG